MKIIKFADENWMDMKLKVLAKRQWCVKDNIQAVRGQLPSRKIGTSIMQKKLGTTENSSKYP